MDGVMSYEDFVKALKKGVNSPVYLFFGTEKYLLKEALKLLKSRLLSGHELKWNYQELEAQNIDAEALFSAINAVPILGGNRVLVIKDAGKYFGTEKTRQVSKEEEQVLQGCLDHTNPACYVVFVVEGKIDGRAKFYKKVMEKGIIVEITPVRGARLIKWLNSRLAAEGKQMDRRAMEYLIACSGDNLAIIEQELQKIFLYAENMKVISLDIIKEIIGKSSKVSIFEVVDAVGDKDAARAIELIREMLATGASPVYIFFMIVRQFRLMLHAKDLLNEGFSEKQAATRLRLHPYAFRKVLEQSKNFSENDLKRILKYLFQVDLSLKTSSANPRLLLEVAVLSMCI